MIAWIQANEALLWSLTVVGFFTFIATLVAVPLLVARLPSDYFVRRPVRDWKARRPMLHLLLVIAKNILGVVLLLAGLAMLVLPGQGLLTILIAIMLLDFPGKRRWERWLISHRPIVRAANWIRAKNLRPPLELPHAAHEAQ